jgi:hypothetical protein
MIKIAVPTLRINAAVVAGSCSAHMVMTAYQMDPANKDAPYVFVSGADW